MTRVRCPWAAGKLMTKYHDDEWGRPKHDDATLFELLILEGAQAGLSWSTILEKREGYRAVFADFDPRMVSMYDEKKIDAILSDSRIVRNRLKVRSAVNNAAAFCHIQEEHGSFDRYIWKISGPAVKNSFEGMGDIPQSTQTSRRMSQHLRRDGFTFVGPIICYAYMQSVGMVNDHLVRCFVHDAIR